MVRSDPRHTECSNLTEARWALIYMYNHENNVPSWLSPQWLCGNSCNWEYGVYNANHVPNCMSYDKAIVVITRRAHCFHD